MRILWVLVFLRTIVISAQEQAWVFFESKSEEVFSLEDPIAFLTEKAVLRKQKFNIPIDERDLPVSPDCIAAVKGQLGITYYSTSKWFNAVYVEGTFEQVSALTDLDCVASVFFMDRSLNLTSMSYQSPQPLEAITRQSHRSKIVEEQKITLTTNNTDPQIEQIGLDHLHDQSYQGEGITIAVIDNGFYNVDNIPAFDRAREKGLLLGGYNFKDHTDAIYETTGTHGTQVLSTMLGYIEGEYKGTAIDAQYYLFKTEISGDESPREEALWIAAAERADSLGVDMLNTSLGYTTFNDSKYDYTVEDMDGQTTFISQGVNIALEKGMLPVTSAGNYGNRPWRIISAPADAPGTLSIGAVSANGIIANFSSRGNTADGRVKPDVVALGSSSVIINSTGNIATSHGTSFSGPIVCGAVACLWQSLPDTPPAEIMDMVRQSGNRYHYPSINYGYGIPDLSFPEDETIIEEEPLVEDKNDVAVYNNIVDSDRGLYLEINNEKLIGQTYYIYAVSGELVGMGVLQATQILEVDQYNTGIYYIGLEDSSKLTKFVVK